MPKASVDTVFPVNFYLQNSADKAAEISVRRSTASVGRMSEALSAISIRRKALRFCALPSFEVET